MTRAQSRFSPAFLVGVLAIGAALSFASTAEEVTISDIETVAVDKQTIVFVSRNSAVSPQAMSETMGAAYTTLLSAMRESDVAAAGPPWSIYHSFGSEEAKYDVAFPIAADDKPKLEARTDVSAREMFAGNALIFVHVGPYDKLIESYNKIMAHMAAENLEPSGPSWEIYMNDPRSAAPAELLTEIYFPLE